MMMKTTIEGVAQTKIPGIAEGIVAESHRVPTMRSMDKALPTGDTVREIVKTWDPTNEAMATGNRKELIYPLTLRMVRMDPMGDDRGQIMQRDQDTLVTMTTAGRKYRVLQGVLVRAIEHLRERYLTVIPQIAKKIRRDWDVMITQLPLHTADMVVMVPHLPYLQKMITDHLRGLRLEYFLHL
jgi:hypothetical protein